MTSPFDDIIAQTYGNCLPCFCLALFAAIRYNREKGLDKMGKTMLCCAMSMEYCLADARTRGKSGGPNSRAVFYHGKFVTVNLLDVAALKRLLKK